MTLFTDLQPLSRVDHADLCLQPIPGYRFAAEVAEIPVFGYELRHLVAVLPLAFRIEGGRGALVGITGVDAGANVFVGPNGGWNAIATPEALTTYPFTMRTAADGSPVLAADMASALLSRDEGDPLLDEAGAPTPVITESLGKLRAQLRDRHATARAIAALWNAGVLAPWQADDITSLDPSVHYHVQVAALAGLSAETQAELARQDALSLAYAQAYSMANMRKLRRMGRRPAKRQQQQPDVDKYLKGDDALDFGDDLVLDFG
jgi:hypothetical protein